MLGKPDTDKDQRRAYSLQWLVAAWQAGRDQQRATDANRRPTGLAALLRRAKEIYGDDAGWSDHSVRNYITARRADGATSCSACRFRKLPTMPWGAPA